MRTRARAALPGCPHAEHHSAPSLADENDSQL
jgi:hypothetical protein